MLDHIHAPRLMIDARWLMANQNQIVITDLDEVIVLREKDLITLRQGRQLHRCQKSLKAAAATIGTLISP